MDAVRFADHITARIRAEGWEGAKEQIHGVNLPLGWEGFLSGMFDDLRERPLVTGLGVVAEMSREELSWPEGDLPSPLDQVTHVIKVSYEIDEPGNQESAAFTFPILQIDGEWRIVLVG